jgi:iron only hydrogenase large subunit-like protein
MHKRKSINFVENIKERCKMCYTCVRECPARAIRIVDGQAEIINERCIGCGNCVRVCSQSAKVVHKTKRDVARFLEGSAKVSACVAPSFPAAFPETDYKKVIGSLREMGFDYVHEVAFGADLVAAAYNELLQNNPGGSYIGTTCPALVNYIECYYKELVPYLSP